MVNDQSQILVMASFLVTRFALLSTHYSLPAARYSLRLPA